MLGWFKKLRELVANHKQLLKVVASYDRDHSGFISRLVQAENLIKDRTDISVDVHMRSPSQVIVTGRYRNQDYVEIFTMADTDLASLISQLREMQRYGKISKIDAPTSFKAIIERELL